MKTLIFDLSLTLRGIVNAADHRAALDELSSRDGLGASSMSRALDDWNFLRVPEAIATEMADWQAAGSPLHVSPLKDARDWARFKHSLRPWGTVP